MVGSRGFGCGYMQRDDLGRRCVRTAVDDDVVRVLGVDHRYTLASRNDLARAYLQMGDLARAMPLLRKTLLGYEQILGDDHPDTLTARHNLAVAYYSAGKLSRAIPLLEQNLADRQRILGKDHPDTLMSLNNLAKARITADK